MSDIIIGRKAEQEILRQRIESKSPELIAIYGRRRIGKTYLVRQYFKDTYRSIFNREEAKTIKSVMEAFGKDKEDYRAIGTFLVFTADKKETLSNSEYCKASREVDDMAIGRYEQAQKRGNSIKL